MNKKIRMRMLSFFLCFVMLFGLMPITVFAAQQPISAVVATAQNLEPTLYGLIKFPEFTITEGSPAYLNSTSGNLKWQKNIEGIWTDQTGRFTPGEWRISTSMRIDMPNSVNYKLDGNGVTLKVNGQDWTVETHTISNHGDYSFASVYSSVFTVVDDPNVQPPVAVESVHMKLNGYEPGAASASATVTTDANVTVSLLGFMRYIDSDSDGVPDTTELFTGNFASGEIYIMGLEIEANPGYDISGLTDEKLSLDRAMMGMAGFDTDSETISGLYLLGDAMQYTVSFETNGGSAIQSVLVGSGQKVAEPAAPTRAYYAFAGWYSDAELTAPFDFENTYITADTTIYAKWKDLSVRVDMKTGDKIENYTSEQEIGLELLLYKGLLIQDGGVKGYRNTQGKLLFTIDTETYLITVQNDVTAQDTISYELTPEEQTLVLTNYGLDIAKVVLNFVPNAPATYTVSFAAGDGTGTMADVNGVSGEYTLPANGFTAPDGKQFKAWSVGGAEKAAGEKITVTANTTVTAVWENIPVINTVTATVSGAEAGATAGSATVTAGDSAYTVSILGWYDCDNVFNYASATKLQPGDKFVGGKTYTVGVQFTPVGSNVLANNVGATINGEDGKLGAFDGNSRNFYITVSVPAIVIQSADVYVDPPINGSKLDYTLEVTGTPPYTVEARRWFKGGNVGIPGPEITDVNALAEPGTNYVLDFTVAPKEGYTLDHSAVVKINGTTAMRVATVSGTDIGVYRAEFTSPKIEITAANAIITAPVAGANPSYTVTSSDPEKYDVSVSKWFKYQGGQDIDSLHVFEAGTSYAVRIVFTAKPGYTFIGATTYTVNSFATSGYGEPSACQIVFDIPADPPRHDFNENEWGYKDSTGHAHLCGAPGCVNHYDTIVPHTPSAWIHDTSVHVKKCTVCGYELEREQHVDNNNDGYCDVCERVEYVTVEIPFTKVVEQTGEKLPGKKTFQFEIFDFGHSEAADHVEIVADTVTTDGKGNFEGVLKLKLTKKGYLNECYLDEGFYVKEVIETEEGWTYSTAVWYAEPNPNGEGWIFHVVENGNVSPEKKDAMIFTNSYQADQPPQTGDDSRIPLWIVLLGISGLCAAATAVIGKKRLFVK